MAIGHDSMDWFRGKFTPYLMVKSMVSCRFSLKPIHWMIHGIDFPLGWSIAIQGHSSTASHGLTLLLQSFLHVFQRFVAALHPNQWRPATGEDGWDMENGYRKWVYDGIFCMYYGIYIYILMGYVYTYIYNMVCIYIYIWNTYYYIPYNIYIRDTYHIYI